MTVTPAMPTIETPATEGRDRSVRTILVTYSPEEWALLQGRFPMSEDDWDAMIAVLTAMKRGLVAKTESGDES
jgi:hypothetical protein